MAQGFLPGAGKKETAMVGVTSVPAAPRRTMHALPQTALFTGYSGLQQTGDGASCVPLSQKCC